MELSVFELTANLAIQFRVSLANVIILDEVDATSAVEFWR
jgi:hypothetical protein